MAAESDKESKIYDDAYRGDLDSVKKAVDENPPLAHTQDKNERLLLHWAALSGSQGLVLYLLEKGSYVSHRDDMGMTPLILAASAGRTRVCHVLISKGANVNEKTDLGHSSLQYAASKGWNEIVKMLLINHCDINISDKRGATPLHRAASKGMVQVVKILLDFGKNILIDATDSYGNTPLHLCCEENRVDVAQQLLAHGAKAEIKNKEGKTARELASSEIKQLIEAHAT